MRATALGVVGALAELAACTGPAPVPALARERVPAWQVRPAGGARAIEPGTTSDALLDPAACASCHPAIAAEWATSRHAQAWTNSIFRTEFDAHPQAWCVNCHAPLTTQQAGLAAGDHRRADQGVDCATCHVRAGAIVSAQRGAASPHATVVDPTFGTPAFCADCHEFTFPVLDPRTGDALALTTHPMQTTVSSFRAGPFADEPAGCQACHGGGQGHAFPGAHAPAMLEAALEVAWCRRATASGEVLGLAIANIGAGHAVPTGDIHRHAALRVWRSSAPELLTEVFLGRRFEDVAGGGKATVWDSSIGPGQTRRHELPVAALGGEPDEPLNLELVYVFIQSEFPRAHRLPAEPTTHVMVRRRERVEALPACAP